MTGTEIGYVQCGLLARLARCPLPPVAGWGRGTQPVTNIDDASHVQDCLQQAQRDFKSFQSPGNGDHPVVDGDRELARIEDEVAGQQLGQAKARKRRSSSSMVIADCPLRHCPIFFATILKPARSSARDTAASWVTTSGQGRPCSTIVITPASWPWARRNRFRTAVRPSSWTVVI